MIFFVSSLYLYVCNFEDAVVGETEGEKEE